MHLVMCHGPVDKLLEIQVGERKVWEGSVASGQVTIDAPDVFGGEDREGGISGAVDFDTGAETQPQNSYLMSVLGADVPKFLGVCAAILRQMYIGTNPYLKDWMFRISRVLQGWNGGTAWYATKAEIGSYSAQTYSASLVAAMDNQAAGPLAEVNGEIWCGTRTGAIRRYNATTGAALSSVTLSERAYPPMYHDIAGGYVWTQRTATGTVWRISTSSLSVTTFSSVVDITNGLHYDENNGTLWKRAGATLRRVNKDTLAVEVIVTLAVVPYDLQFDQGGDIWYVDNTTSKTLYRTTQAGATSSWVLSQAASDLMYLTFDPPRNSVWIRVNGPLGVLQFDLAALAVTRTITSPPAATLATYDWSDLVYANGFIFSQNSDRTLLVINAATGSTSVVGTLPSGYNTFESRPVIYDGRAYSLSGDATKFNIIKWVSDALPCQRMDMNPAHIIYQCLTDPEWGMGYPTADIDDASFTAAADTLYSESMGMSILWDRGAAIEDFIKEVLKHIDAVAYVDRTTGKFKLKLIRNDYTIAALPVIDASNAERVEELKTPSLGELVNTVTVRYWDSCAGKTAAVGAQDLAMVQLQGGAIGTTIDYPGFTTDALAARAAARDLKSLATPLASCKVYANRAAASFNVGDVFRLVWPELSVDMAMRITAMSYGDGKKYQVKIQCVQDVFNLPNAISSGGVSEWADPVSAPAASPNRIVQEAPYYEIVQQLGQTDTDSKLASYPDVGYLLAAGSRSSGDAYHAALYVDAGAGYVDSGTVDFAPYARLAGATTQAATVLTIDSGVDLDTVTIGTHCQIDAELMRVDAVSATSLTVGRGVLDTVAATHSVGASILFWDNFGGSDEVEYVTGEAANVKLLPVTGQGMLAAGLAPVDTVTFAQRAVRPYPPGQLQVNGSYYPAAITGDMALTWAHRNRLQQTSGTLADHTAASIGPEAGTTYTLRIYNSSNTLVRTESGLTGTAYTYTSANETLDGGPFNSMRFELESVRGGLVSRQKHNHTVSRVGYGYNYGYSYGGG